MMNLHLILSCADDNDRCGVGKALEVCLSLSYMLLTIVANKDTEMWNCDCNLQD